MKITVETGAYLPEARQEQFAVALRQQNHSEMIDVMAFSVRDMSGIWGKLGKATITVEIPDEEAIKAGLVDTLRKEKERVLAEAQAQATRIESKIQSLLALEHTPAPEDDPNFIPF